MTIMIYSMTLCVAYLRNSNGVNDRYALAVVGYEDQGSQGYSAF